MRPRLLDRSLALEIAGPFAAALAFLFGLLLTMQLLRGVDVLLGSGVRPADLATIFGYLASHFLAMAMPVSFLFALMLVVGRWSEDRETLALAASGVAPWRLLVAPLGFAAVLALFGTWLGQGPEPRGMASLRAHVNELIKRNMAGDVKPGVFYDALRSMTLYSQGVSPKTRRFTNVLLSDERDSEASLLVLAREGVVDPHGGGGTLRLVLQDGEIHRSSAQGDDYAVVTFQKASMDIGVGGDLLRNYRFGASRDELSPAELVERSAKAAAIEDWGAYRNFEVAWHHRLAAPLAVLAFAACGVPLALRRRQRSRALGAVATLGVYVGYYVCSRGAELAAERGSLSPFVGAHLANAAFLALGLVLLWRAARVEA